MKKTALQIFVILLLSVSAHYAQTLTDYVSEVRGDTLVIKDYNDMGSVSNSLYNALLLDTTNVPAGRVYMLKTNGYYPLANNPTTSSQRPTVIVGENSTMLVSNKDANSAPPLVCGSTIEGGSSNGGGINMANSFTIKNINIVPAASDGTLNWAFFVSGASNISLTFDNCLMERTRWVFVQGNNEGLKMYFKNCYFVNMNGQPCRRNGGVYDGFSNEDSLVVENCTHVMAQGTIWKFRQNIFNRVIFNHNTFVNCAGSLFMNLGYQSNMSVTNNIFVNSNIQPYCAIRTIDAGEQDPDFIPMGLVDVYPDTADINNHVPRKFLVEGNVIYWDPSLDDMNATLDANSVNGVTNWQSQMITMNTRTQNMFNDNTTYPYLSEGVWYKEMPTFTDSKDLFTTQLANLKAFAVGTVDTNSTNVLPDWRLVNIGTNFYVYSDWPIPVDLSYSNADLLKGATSGFPVGDLNWFPAKKATWLAQRTAEYAKIDNALNTGTTTIITAVNDKKVLPLTFQISQNYPNPFNPSTVISFSIPKAGNVTLKVYNDLGQEVATLINGYKLAQTYNVEFNASNLASGIYYYTVNFNNQSLTKKMILLK